MLLRKAIGAALRARRLAQRRTLRDVSSAANVSLGYLSEIERGHKEASSELLASICDALGTRLSEMLSDVSTTIGLAEQAEPARPRPAGVQTGAARVPVPAGEIAIVAAPAGVAPAGVAAGSAVTDGRVTVMVHADSPLHTRLTMTRTPPGRRTEPLLIG